MALIGKVAVNQPSRTILTASGVVVPNIALVDLNDVNATGLQDNYTLVYDSDTAKWEVRPANNFTAVSTAYNQANASFDRANTANATAYTASNNVVAAFNTANAAFAAANIALYTPQYYVNSAAQFANLAFTHAQYSFITANSASYYANLAYIQANAAFAAANAASIDTFVRNQANAAFIEANSAFIQANAAFAYANSLASIPDYLANSAATYANGAFIQANAAFISVNSAFAAHNTTAIFANTPSVVANSSFIQANAAFVHANAAFAAANSVDPTDTYARSTANVALIQANGAFVAANTAEINRVGASIYANGAFAAANAAIAVNTTQNNSIDAAFAAANVADSKAISAGNYANAAFAAANAASGGNATDGFARNQANSAFIQANAAFAAANSGAGQLGAFNHANAAFDAGNTATSLQSAVNLTQNNSITVALNTANAAFTAANSGAGQLGAFNQANAAFIAANAAIAVNETQNNSITVALNTANAAFAVANAGGGAGVDSYARETANAATAVNLTQNNSITVALNTANASFAQGNAAAGIDTTQNNSITAAFIHANAAFAAANAGGAAGVDAYARDTANAAFLQANNAASGTVDGFSRNTGNAAFITANSAFIHANFAFAAANSALSTESGQNQRIQQAYDQSNASFTAANSSVINTTAAFYHANAAFAAANNATDTYVRAHANAAFDTANGAVAVNLTQNNSITVALNTANAAFTAANNATDTFVRNHANAAFDTANGAVAVNLTQNNSIIVALNTANAAFSAANNATDTYVRNHANAAFDTANGAVAVNETQNNSIAAAFTRANNSLNANTGGQITGDVTVTGNLVVVGNTVYANTLTVLIADNIITLNAAINQSGSPLANAGIEVDRGNQPNSSFLWVEADGKWAANNGNTMFYVGSEADITAAGNYANAAFATANAAAAGSVDSYARDTANAAFLAANNISVVGNTINLGTPTDGSLTNIGAYTGWSTVTSVTDAIDDLNEMLDNVRANTFVKSVSFTASPLGAGSGSVVTLTVVPVTSNGNIRYDVDWGDGGANTTACTSSTITRTYTVQGSKTITVRAYNNAGSGTGSEASNTRSSYVVIYTPDPVMGFRFYRVSSGGNALTAAANLYFTEGDTLYMENITTNTTGAAVTYTANFGDSQPNTSIASDTASGGVFGSRLAYTYGFAASSGTGYLTANLVLTSSNTSNPASIPRSVTTSIKVYDANIAAPNPLSSKTITFSGSTGTLPYLAAEFANNTGGATTYTVGTLVNRTTATSGNIAITDMTTFAANANVGTLTAFVNGANSGARAFTNGSDTGTFNSLSVLSESDYNLLDATGTATTFAASIYSPGYFTGFKANVSTAAAAVPLGVNNFQLQHSANGNTNVVEFVKDDITSAPTTTAGSLTVGTANYRYISGIPYFTTGATVNMVGATITNWIGQCYTGVFNTATPVQIAGGTNYESTTAIAITPTAFTYAQVDGATTYLQSGYPKANTGKSSAYTLGTLNVPIAASVRTVEAIGIRANNVAGNGSLVENSTRLAVHSAAQSGISEIAIVATGVGSPASGAGANESGIRSHWFKANTSNTPVYTSATNFYTTQVYSESSDPGVAGTKEATIRIGAIKHDVTDYSTGYLPVGPNRSGDTGTQYFTFAFRRTALSNFDINITSATGVAGVWLAAPGTGIDTSSGLNGWLECGTVKAASGQPGTGVGGNGSDGCALSSADRILGGTALSGGYTMSLGTENMSNATGNVVLIRIGLSAGQSITTLSIGVAA